MAWGRRQVERSHRKPGVTLVTEDPQQLPHGLSANAPGLRAPADGCTQGTVHVPGTAGAPRVVTPKWIFEKICRGKRAAELEARPSEVDAASPSSAAEGDGEAEDREDAVSEAGSDDSDADSEEY